MTVEEFKKTEKELKTTLIREIKKMVKDFGQKTVKLFVENLQNDHDWAEYYFNVQPMVANQFSLVDMTSNVDYLEVSDGDILCHVIGENIDKKVSISDLDSFSVYDYDNIIKLMKLDGVIAINTQP